MGARQDLAAKLAEALPKNFKIISYPRSVDQIERGHPVLMLVQETIRRSPAAPQGAYEESFALWLLATKTVQPAAEDELDELLGEVIVALDDVHWLTWNLASRAIYGAAESGVPAYKIDFIIQTSKGSTNS